MVLLCLLFSPWLFNGSCRSFLQPMTKTAIHLLKQYYDPSSVQGTRHLFQLTILGKLVDWRGHVTRTLRVMLQHVFENILDSHELISMQPLLDYRVVWTFSRALFVKDYQVTWQDIPCTYWYHLTTLKEHSIGLVSYWTQGWFTCCFYWCLGAILSQSPYGSATDETVAAYESSALIVNAVSIDWHLPILCSFTEVGVFL